MVAALGMVWAAVRVFAFGSVPMGIVLFAFGGITAALAARQLIRRFRSPDSGLESSGELSKDEFDYIVWVAVGLPVLLVLGLLIFVLRGRAEPATSIQPRAIASAVLLERVLEALRPEVGGSAEVGEGGGALVPDADPRDGQLGRDTGADQPLDRRVPCRAEPVIPAIAAQRSARRIKWVDLRLVHGSTLPSRPCSGPVSGRTNA